MRQSLKDLRYAIEFWGNDIDEDQIDLRKILMAMLEKIDQALPQEVEPD